jgi:hypothetical protein
MDRIIVFILGVPLGMLMMIYRHQLKEITGEIEWAERNLGSGGTYTLIIIIGLAVSILSVMYAFGTLQTLFSGSLGSFF